MATSTSPRRGQKGNTMQEKIKTAKARKEELILNIEKTEKVLFDAAAALKVAKGKSKVAARKALKVAEKNHAAAVDAARAAGVLPAPENTAAESEANTAAKKLSDAPAPAAVKAQAIIDAAVDATPAVKKKVQEKLAESAPEVHAEYMKLVAAAARMGEATQPVLTLNNSLIEVERGTKEVDVNNIPIVSSAFGAVEFLRPRLNNARFILTAKNLKAGKEASIRIFERGQTKPTSRVIFTARSGEFGSSAKEMSNMGIACERITHGGKYGYSTAWEKLQAFYTENFCIKK